jgi:tetratricopeptide (TPR) repeat protein
LRQWVTLYPDDLQAHLTLMSSYVRRNRLDEAKAEAAQVIALDPGNPRYLLQLARVYEIKGDNASAVEQYLRYQEKAPTDPYGYVRAALVYAKLARHDDAMKSYEKALAVAPDDITAIVGMSEVQMQTGRMELAQATLDRGLKQSPGDEDKARLLDQQARLWGVLGQWQRAVDEARKSWAILKSTQRQMTFLQRQLDQMAILVHAGRADEALATIHQAEASDNVNVTIFSVVALAEVYTELRDAARARAAVDKLEGFIKTYDIEEMQSVAADYRGRVADIEGSYAAAIASYEQALAQDPSAEEMLLRLARCRRMLKQYKDAHQLLARALARFPAMPEAHDELARLYVDEGDRKQAGVEIAAALKVWANADPGYGRAADAQKLAADLRPHP